MSQRGYNNQRGNSSQVGRNSARQQDLYNTGMPGDNPFQTMYQATIGQRAQTSQGKRAGKTVSMTPNVKASAKMAMSQDRWNQITQSASKLSTAAKREQIRRFGEYHGEDGNQPMQQT